MRKKLVITLIGTLLAFTMVVGAASINGDFKGFPIVKVNVNGVEVASEVPAVNFFGKTVLPVADIAKVFNTVIEWDSTTWTANLVKPQVDMIFADGTETIDDAEVITNPFRYMHLGNENIFTTYVDVDKLKPGAYEFRILILAPNGETIGNSGISRYEVPVGDSSFYWVREFEDVPFDEAGNYTFQFQIKYNDTFKTVYEKDMFVVGE
ncbi:hypothetical protein [Geosporobacter ferrireducens]|uniref:Copper amine oxidase-like N-terminal domain-containing protein n=1 Tax=Geosporobacter ferrireducens TaxID=1424294 RepID=A0A1D8GCS5_9FIRM|nr:hypothetical protein [Geosporobacter ferrireducens]AOT68711.1 hypothetical protein Gferi_03435 [Geosporobacter ferrireducens]MTI57599.1 hypothetical protein [Geosporobacter ferrireducens]